MRQLAVARSRVREEGGGGRSGVPIVCTHTHTCSRFAAVIVREKLGRDEVFFGLRTTRHDFKRQAKKRAAEKRSMQPRERVRAPTKNCVTDGNCSEQMAVADACHNRSYFTGYFSV